MMSDGQRLWRGLLIAVLLHISVLVGLMLAGFLTPPPPAPQEDPAEVSMVDEPEPEIPVPVEEIAALPEEAEPDPEPVPPPPPPEPEKPKVLPQSKPVPPQQPKEKPPLPTERKNLFDTDADVVKAFVAPILDKRQEVVIKPGTPLPLQPFVVIDIIIGKDGKVEKAAVSIPSGSPEIDEAALASVRQYLFIPGKDKQGKPIRCSFSITLIL